jgi:hypothetical protein
MINVGDHGLTCLDGEDYGAWALYMQCTAEQIDSVLAEQQTQLNLFRNRPAIVVAPLANTITNDTHTLYNTVLFDNSPFLSLVTNFNGTAPTTQPTANGIAIGSPVGSATVVPYLKGEYEFGVYAEGIATALVPNQPSRAELIVFGPDGQSLIVNTNPSRRNQTFQTQEDLAGNHRINGKVTFVLNGISGVTCVARIFKSGSTATWTTASFIWVRYLGPPDQVEVA